jgi:hypothetical protein
VVDEYGTYCRYNFYDNDCVRCREEAERARGYVVDYYYDLSVDKEMEATHDGG